MVNTRRGLLTIFSPDRHEIYGEFVDGSWDVAEVDGTVNHSFKGTASDGTAETFQRLDSAGISNVAIAFETSGARYTGEAQLLRPNNDRSPGEAMIVVETTVPPALE